MSNWATIMSDAIFEGGNVVIEFEADTRQEAVELISRYGDRLNKKWQEVPFSEPGHLWLTLEDDEDADEPPSITINVYVDLENEQKNNG